MNLLPIYPTPAENPAFIDHPDCKESVFMTMDYYRRIGFHPPWIGYFAEQAGKLMGMAGFKGAPRDGKIEIAYGTFPAYEGQGVGTKICHQLVLLAQQTDPSVRITARTLPENNASAHILRKNGFTLLGTIFDEEDGNVWEWELLTS